MGDLAEAGSTLQMSNSLIVSTSLPWEAQRLGRGILSCFNGNPDKTEEVRISGAQTLSFIFGRKHTSEPIESRKPKAKGKQKQIQRIGNPPIPSS
jgi:hypothetical protein